ncbi:hypothetical protein SDC9_112926 [bioreactor metagenome]|uniref:Uncharacterized protein n=1 Tax=bioreactor metagenome TaxID=1076179 RepID=A0A645BLG3_9ZZZZ
MSRETENFSMYSLISIRTICSSESNKFSAKALANSVFPTPVGPKKRKDPIGRFGDWRPARERKTAFVTLSTASSWPMTRLCSVSSNFRSLSLSPSTSFVTGMPVIRPTTVAISFSVTDSWTRLPALFLRVAFSFSRAANSFSI